MSDALVKETAGSVNQTVTDTTSPVEDEKHNPTSLSTKGPDLPSRPSTPLDDEKQVVHGAAGEDKRLEAGGTSATNDSLAPAQQQSNSEHDEKHAHVTEGNASSGADNAVTQNGGDTTEGSSEDGEIDIVYPSGSKLILLTFGLCMATFVVALDNTIIATAIPKITTVFNSLGDVGWYGSSYLLTTTALQPSFGRIYTYFDVKWTYLIALLLFEFGSILCAAAANSVMLIVGRAVAGAGASALFSGSMTIIGFTVPLEKRPIYIGGISSMFGVSSVVGPLLGGAFTDRVSWRWCFWINLPFGAVSLAAVYFFFHPPKRKISGMTVKQRILEIDLLGAFFLICAIVCLLLALQWGGTEYPWKNSKVWGLFLGFGLLIIIFIAQQFRRGDRATIPPRIFKQRTVLYACLYSCFLSMALYTHIFYLPFFFQAVKNTTAEGSGIRTIPYLASIIISSLVVGGGITVIGWYMPFMIFGGVVFTIGAGLLYTLHVSSGAAAWIGYQLVCGFGAGAGIQIPFIAVQVVLSSKDIPTGSAIAIFFNSLGGAISISIAQNIFATGLTNNVPKYAPGVDAQTVIRAGATYLRQVVSPEDLPGVVQAYMKALNEAYIPAIAFGGIATFCACFVEWKSVKGKKIVPAGA
ncbi:putative major facilitator superfamily transporter [Bisporella sp. PMI_857]|nr:putative major facilitator superfamily transporter [Bisporella sp. PMI_857]